MVFGLLLITKISGMSFHLSTLNGLGPWIIGGDFNASRFQSVQSLGGHVTRTMRKFNSFISLSGLQDSHLCNSRFTRTDDRHNPILCRLDRILIYLNWEDTFPHFLQKAYSRLTSDHWPIVMHIMA